MIIKFRFPCNKLKEFRAWENKWIGHIHVRKKPTDDGLLPLKYKDRCSEPLLFAEVEIIDFKDDKRREAICKRLILDELFDLTGFYPLDNEHLTSDSFNFYDEVIREIQGKLTSAACDQFMHALKKTDSSFHKEWLEESREDKINLIKFREKATHYIISLSMALFHIQ